ncbi:MAG TPA: PAS domain-containing protein [Vicinamibacterales bacterium]|nr:PAS domain-containing protein [Vicinamibacterales bacterium]
MTDRPPGPPGFAIAATPPPAHHQVGERFDTSLLAGLVESVPLLLATFDLDRRYVFVNRSYAERFGRQPADLIGRSIVEFLGEKTTAVIAPYIERVLAGEAVSFEVTIDYPHHPRQTMRSTLTPRRDAAGNVIGWHGAAENVTQARRTEERLRQFGIVLHRTSDFVGMFDLAFRPFFVNDAGAALVGLPRGDDFPADLSVFDLIAPDHHDFLRGTFFPAVQRDGHATADVQFRHVGSGLPIWMEYSVVRLDDEEGRPTGYATISRNLTETRAVQARLVETAREQERSLRRFSELADSLPQIVWSLTADGTHDYFNRRWIDLMGAQADGPANVWDPIHPDDLPRCTEAWQRALAEGAPFELQYRLRFPGQADYRWYLGRTVPVKDAGGQIVRWYGTSTDIHEQKRVEEALLAADRQKDEFLGVLSHELRNPLTPLVFAVSQIARTVTDPATGRAVEVISRQVGRLRALVDDLMDLSRVRMGKIDLNTRAVDMRRVVQHSVEAARPQFERRGHTVTVHLPDDPAMVLADEQRLGQVIDNLLINAVKYTPNGGAISLRVDAEGDEVVTQVRDTGIGIDHEMLPRIFELFTQDGVSRARAEGGLGIGLALVERLVRLHGGSVTASSAGADLGAEFVVRLPTYRGVRLTPDATMA